MSMIRSLFCLLLFVPTLLVGGCTPDDAQTTSAPIEHSVEDAQTETRLQLRVNTESIGIADRIWLEARWVWPDETEVSITDPDWSEGDWTLIETVDEPAKRSGDLYEASRRWLIEPFLPGQYSIPSPVLRIGSDDDARELEADPFTISVEGVLPDQDAGELNPLAAPAIPEEQHQSRSPILIGAIGVVVLLAIVVLLIARRGSGQHDQETVYTQLRRIESDAQLDQQKGFELLDRAFARLDPRLRQTSEFAEMIRACDRARFAQHHEEKLSPARIARHALQLLGHDHASSARGGAA